MLGHKRFAPVLLLFASLFLLIWAVPVYGDAGDSGKVTLTLVGRAVDTQGGPVDKAEVRVFVGGSRHTLLVNGRETGSVHTDADGFYVSELVVDRADLATKAITVEIGRHGFRTARWNLIREDMTVVGEHCNVRVPDTVLPRNFNPAFFLATAIFVVVFGLISLNLVHETAAALAGAAAMLGVTYFAGSSNPDFWIIGFDEAVAYIDFNVIFLVMTLMVFVAVVSKTGVFRWLAFQTFRLSRGNAFLAVAILVSLTGITSSVLENTTVVLIIAPVSIQIALALGIHPAAIVVPEILASNIGGAATLIGTPPNTIIGSRAGLSFNQFLINMAPMALMSMLVLLGMTRWLYRDEFDREHGVLSPPLLAQLEAGSRITDRTLLSKSLLVFAATLLLFFMADRFHMPPAAVGILGSSVLLLWVRPNVSEMLHEVDWTTLVFFIALFMMVGGIQEVGLIQIMAELVKKMAGDSLLLAVLLVVWVSAIASSVVANIPFSAAMVPVVVYLTRTIPGANNNVLYWALALGASLGGNATYIGSAPNIVAAGIMDRAGYRLRFGDFSRVGVPVTLVTVLVPTLWIMVRYFWLKF